MSSPKQHLCEYFCDVCNDLRDDTLCDVCGLPTRPATDDERSVPTIAVGSSNAVTSGVEGTSEAPSVSATADPRSILPPIPPPPGSRSRSEPAEPASSAEPAGSANAFALPSRTQSADDQEAARSSSTPRAFQRAEQQIGEYLDQGFEIFLIAGVAGSGKTELLEAYKAGKSMKEVPRRDGRAISTAPGDLDCHPFPAEGRKILFVDASGEHFRSLYRDSSKGETFTFDDVYFLKIFAHRLTGLTLLVNLRQQWQPGSQDQVKVFRNLLSVLRFLVGGGTYERSARDLQSQIDARLPHTPRLRMPVQLLLSKADELTGLPLPERPDDAWMGVESDQRKLFPVGEDPLALLHHYLPGILKVLDDHVKTFRVDFAHSLLLDPDSGAVTSHVGCGIELSRQWLVERSARSWAPQIPTRWWLRTQRVIDRLLRRDRWRRLPDPVSLRRGHR